MILPGFGIVSQSDPGVRTQALFGYSSMVYATASIAILRSSLGAPHVHGRHAHRGYSVFMYADGADFAVPTGVKVSTGLATIGAGR